MPQKERWREPRKKTLKGREATKTMENYKKDGNYSAEGRKLRPRKKVSFNDNSSEQRSFGERSERRSYGNGGGNGERKSYGERRSFGERKSDGGNDQKRPYKSGERKGGFSNGRSQFNA